MRLRSSAETSISAGERRNTFVATLSKEPRKAKARPGREVDESLGVGVAHFHQIHDHRRAIAEPLADGACLPVIPGSQGGDLRQRSTFVEQSAAPGFHAVESGFGAERRTGRHTCRRYGSRCPRRDRLDPGSPGRRLVAIEIVVREFADAVVTPDGRVLVAVRRGVRGVRRFAVVAIPLTARTRRIIEVIVLVILERHHSEVGLELVERAHRSPFPHVAVPIRLTAVYPAQPFRHAHKSIPIAPRVQDHPTSPPTTPSRRDISGATARAVPPVARRPRPVPTPVAGHPSLPRVRAHRRRRRRRQGSPVRRPPHHRAHGSPSRLIWRSTRTGVERSPESCAAATPLAKAPGEPEAVDRVDRVRPACDGTRLVPLEPADHVPLDLVRHPLAELRDLRRRLLLPRLPESAATQFVEQNRIGDGKIFGHHQQ